MCVRERKRERGKDRERGREGVRERARGGQKVRQRQVAPGAVDGRHRQDPQYFFVFFITLKPRVE